MGNPEPKIPFYPAMRRGLAIDLVFVYMMKPEERAKALIGPGKSIEGKPTEAQHRPALQARRPRRRA